MSSEESVSTSRRVRPEASVRIPAHVVHREFPAQTVVLNLQTGRYYGLNPTAGRMLVALETGATIAAAARQVADRYGEPQADVERDLLELCSQMLERQLVELIERDGS
jgi:hypothetical protein